MRKLLERSLKLLDKLVWLIGPYFPCTRMNNIWRGLDKEAKSILDVGGGRGEPMKFLNRSHHRFVVNADITLSYLEESRKRQTHSCYLLCDARRLPFKIKSFDIVLCSELIEHIEKRRGYRLLKDLEEIARKQIIVTTPNNPKPDWEPEGIIGAIDAGHISSWKPAEFKALKYKVRGDGFPLIKGRLLSQNSNKLVALLGYLLYVMASPFVYYFPSKAGGMTCIKCLEDRKS